MMINILIIVYNQFGDVVDGLALMFRGLVLDVFFFWKNCFGLACSFSWFPQKHYYFLEIIKYVILLNGCEYGQLGLVQLYLKRHASWIYKQLSPFLQLGKYLHWTKLYWNKI
jgi:hypothetical protein